MNHTPVTVPLHLHRLEVSNFMRLKTFTVDADGKHVVFRGKNATGKSTAIQALAVALGGLSRRKIPEPVTRGQQTAQIVADFGDILIERTFSADGEDKLIVKGKDGEKLPNRKGGPGPRTPKELLDQLWGTYSIDPVRFLDQRDQDQLDDVLQLLQIKPPVERVQEITGERHEPRPGESADTYLMRLSADDSGIFYLRRREKNVELTRKTKALEEADFHLRQLGGPLKEGANKVSVSDLTARLLELTEQQAARASLQAEAQASAQELERGLANLENVRQAHAQHEARVRALQAQMDEIQRQMELEREVIAGLKVRLDEGQKTVNDLDGYAAQDKTAYLRCPDPAPQILHVREQIDLAEVNRQALAKRQAASDERQRLEDEHIAVGAEHARMERILEQLRYLRHHQLDDKKLGIPGLSAGEGELKLNGISLKQASGGQQLRVAVAVGMLQNPDIRMILVDNAERLDSESRGELLQIAEERGFEVFMACVADTEDLQVEIVGA